MSFRRGNSRNKEQFGEDEGDDDQGGADRGGHVQAEQQHRDRHRRQSGGPVPMRQAVPLRWVGTSIRSPATTMRTAKPPKVIAGGNSPFTAAPAKTAGNPASANAAATRQFTQRSPILPKPPNSAAQPTTISDIGTAWQQRRGDAGAPPSRAVHHDRAIGGQLRQAGSQLRERNRDRSRDSAGGVFGRVADVQHGDLPRCPEPVESVGVDPRRAGTRSASSAGKPSSPTVKQPITASDPIRASRSAAVCSSPGRVSTARRSPTSATMPPVSAKRPSNPTFTEPARCAAAQSSGGHG